MQCRSGFRLRLGPRLVVGGTLAGLLVPGERLLTIELY